jgi:hypothetical protein
MAQKAEPLAIEIAPGTTSASVRGQLSGRQETEYSLKVRKGQALSFDLAAKPETTLRLKLYDPSGTEAAIRRINSRRWAASATVTGEYMLAVVRASNRSGTSTYELTVSIH